MKKPQLFLLHFAGGNCYSFQFMLSLLHEFDVIPLELPGRGRRMAECLLKDFNMAAQDICKQLIAKLTSARFLIYGHSMGAYLALRVANMLERAGKFPAYLIVSGNAGPGIESDNKKDFHLLEHVDFVKELECLGGIPPELIQNKELFNFFEPILRADFEISEKNEIATEPAICAPIFAMMGSQEDEVDVISNWARFTRSGFNFEILEGNHFFIHKHPRRIAHIIKSCYREVTLLQRQLSS
jgi:external thioesterase TEII